MQVMDLSKPKPQEVSLNSPPPYTVLRQHHEQQYLSLHQQQYLLHQHQHLMPIQPQPSYGTSPPPTIIPFQPSVSHLGFFQQLHHDNVPQNAPSLSPNRMRLVSPINNNIGEQNYSPVVADSTKEEEPVKKREAEDSCRLSVASKRPFKLIASSKNSSSLNLSSMFNPCADEAYEEYRSKVLSQIARGESEHNKNMRRTIPSNPDKINDPEYMEKRKKNNEAAKKSREARKAKEDEIAIRVSFLEQENLKLKLQLATIERQKKTYLRQLEFQQRHKTTACF